MAASAGSRRFKIFAAADGFGEPLKDAVVAHLRAHPSVADVVDLGVDKYYSAAAAVARGVSSPAPDPALEARGVVVCGTGAGVAIFANKYPGVYATHCSSAADAVNTRSINACNVLALSGMATPPEAAAAIADAWLTTPFRAPCPASGDAPWPEDIQRFFDVAPGEMASIPEGSAAPPAPDSACAICCLRKGMEFEPVDIMPGGEMRIVRESPTSAYVRFKAGSGAGPPPHLRPRPGGDQGQEEGVELDQEGELWPRRRGLPVHACWGRAPCQVLGGHRVLHPLGRALGHIPR
ncbi:hypothetical protein ACQJBY_040800 [Aegilops geniculata]